MKWIKLLIILSFTISTVLFHACTGDFEEMNTNPNDPVTVSPALLLPNGIQVSVDRWWGHSTRYQRLNIDAAMCWIQHLARNIYINAEGDTYEIPLTVSSGTWDALYNDALVNFESMIQLARADGEFENPNYEGVGRVMKSFTFAYMTEVFGPIPYSQALKGADAVERINSPAYDSMEAIYAGLLADLALANELLDVDGPAISGDIMFGGDILRWKKFANSLRLKLANRQASKKQAASATIMTTILSDPDMYPVFTGNDDYAFLMHSDVIGSRNKMFDVFSTRSDWNISTTLINKLLELDDERVRVYAEPAASGEYAGLPNGLTDAAAATFTASTLGDRFVKPTAPSVLMTFAELKFIEAEAALKGYIAGDATVLLEEAISASFDQYGLSMPADYMDRLGVVSEEVIMTQKWIALFGQGIEAWTEYRRTGYPVMPPPHPSSVFTNDGVLPTRIIYPTSEYSLNNENLQQGIQLLGGGDNMQTQLWWVE